MATIKVPVKVITFIHKDTGETASFVFDDNRDTSDSFEGVIFGESYNCTGFYKAANDVTRNGHTENVQFKDIILEI